MEQGAATVYVIDDDADVCSALCYLIESVALAASAFRSLTDFLDAYRPGGLGCLVLDVRMPGMSGIEFLERRENIGIDLPVIMLSGHGTIAMATRSLRAGAIDFVQKPVSEQLLLDRIHEAIEICRRQRAHRTAVDRITMLTPREMEVASQIAAGRHNKEIALALGLSDRTVETHRANAMKKLGAHTTADLVTALLMQPVSRNEPHQQ